MRSASYNEELNELIKRIDASVIGGLFSNPVFTDSTGINGPVSFQKIWKWKKRFAVLAVDFFSDTDHQIRNFEFSISFPYSFKKEFASNNMAGATASLGVLDIIEPSEDA